MEQSKEQILAEIRYAQRLCQRTARLYRHIQTLSVFMALVGGSGAITALSKSLPPWIAITGTALLAVSGALNISIRTADKAVQNEVDVKKYADLLARGQTLTVPEIRAQIFEARKSDAPEVESLRDVAFNDVMREINREDAAIKISAHQKLLAAIA